MKEAGYNVQQEAEARVSLGKAWKIEICAPAMLLE